MTPDQQKIQALHRENKFLTAALGKLMMQKLDLMAALDKASPQKARELAAKFESEDA